MHSADDVSDQSTAQPSLPKLNILAYLSLPGSGVLIFLGLFAIAPMLPAVRAHFETSANVDILVQTIGAMSPLTFAIGSLFSSSVIDRFGFRTVYLVSVLVLGIAGSSAGLMDNLYAIICTRALVGFAAAGIVNGSLVAIGRLLAESAQTRTMALQTLVGSCVAIVLFPVVGTLAGISWRLAFAIHLIAILFVPLVLMLPASVRAAPGAQPKGNLRRAAADLGALVSITAIFSGMVIFAISMFAPMFLVSLGVTSPQLLSIPPTATVIGSATGAWLSVPLLARLSNFQALSYMLILEGLGLATIALSQSWWGVSIGALLAGTGAGALTLTLYAVAIRASGAGSPAAALGLVNALVYGAMILFPLVAMPFAQLVGGPRPMLGTVVLCSLILATSFAVIARSQSRMIKKLANQ